MRLHLDDQRTADRAVAAALFAFEHVDVAGRGAARAWTTWSSRCPDGGITAIAGPSGAGKSSLLRCCNRLEAPPEGVVRYRGEDIAARDPLAHRREVAMVFQKPVLFAGSVADNLRVADPTASDERIAELLRRAALDRGVRRARRELALRRRGAARLPRARAGDRPARAADGRADVVARRRARRRRSRS